MRGSESRELNSSRGSYGLKRWLGKISGTGLGVEEFIGVSASEFLYIESVLKTFDLNHLSPCVVS